VITATVNAPVATLWRMPSSPRPCIDAEALDPQADPFTWVSGLDDAGRYYDGILTQLLQGEPVLVEEIEDGWARVVATAQPAAKLDPRGYPGWLPLDQLRWGEGPHPATRQHRGVAKGELQGLDVLDLARACLGTPYVWGGLTPHGIDCSGLVHLAFRRAGRTVPRDADDQARATTPVPQGEERPGDLYFFEGRSGKVTHVGFVTGPGTILHACGDKGFVVEEPMPADRLATLVGVHRVA
jgi:gamma-D-glutamyl-L-lysine dipeptidyl-peptidase